MRKSLLLIAVLVPLSGIAGALSLAASAGAASVATDSSTTETVASACGSGAPLSADPINLDQIPSQPVTGHLSVQGVGDDDGCGGDDGHEGGEHEGAEGADD
jgi:hypothetical protein